MLAEHHPAATTGRSEGRQRGFSSHFYLPWAGRSSKLFDTIGIHGGTGTAVPQIATAGTERMRTLHSNVVRVKGERVSSLYAVPLEGLQKKLGHRSVTVVGVKNINICGAEPGALKHSPSGAVRPVFYLVQIRLGGALREIVLGMVEYVHGWLPHVPGALGSSDQVGGRGIDRPVTIKYPERIQDIPGIHVILLGKLNHPTGGIVAPRGQKSVSVLVDHKRGQVVVGPTVFLAILIVGEDVDEVVASVVPPGDRPLPGPICIILRVLAAAAIPAFEVSRWIYHQTGGAKPVGYGLGGKTHHFPNGGYVGRGVFYVRQLHLFDKPIGVYQGKTPFRLVGRVEVGPGRPGGRGASTVASDMTLAADDTIDLVRGNSRVLHGQLTGEHRVCAQGLIHGCLVPAPVNGGMTESSHRYLAPVFPDPHPVCISSPLIWSLRSHHSPILITRVFGTDRQFNPPPAIRGSVGPAQLLQKSFGQQPPRGLRKVELPEGWSKN